MSYKFTFSISCERQIDKASRKNPILRKAITNKINEIIVDPSRFKPLAYDLAGECRVHILRCFVLKFAIDEKAKLVVFVFFGHHDDAYRR